MSPLIVELSWLEKDLKINNKNNENLKNRQSHTKENTIDLSSSIIAYIHGYHMMWAKNIRKYCSRHNFFHND